jgi:hypothetical protein
MTAQDQKVMIARVFNPFATCPKYVNDRLKVRELFKEVGW